MAKLERELAFAKALRSKIRGEYWSLIREHVDNAGILPGWFTDVDYSLNRNEGGDIYIEKDEDETPDFIKFLGRISKE